MKLEHKIFAGMALGLVGTANFASAAIEWSTDFDASLKTAASEDKLMLVDFTGSDWCGWCIRLKEEVFSKEAFESTADKYVMVELDFPQDDSLITEEKRAINEELAQKYNVAGFPSIILMTEDGNPIARTGYQEGGPEAYAEHLETIAEPWENLQSAEGEEARGKALLAFLQSLSGETLDSFYSEEMEELKKLSPEGTEEFLSEYELGKQMSSFQEKVGGALAAGEYSEVTTIVDEFIAEHDPKGEDRQNILMAKVMAEVEQGNKEEAFSQLDEIAKIAPEAEIATNLEQIKASITDHLAQREAMEKEAADAETSEETAEDGEPSVTEQAEEAESE
jgi:thioredoxin-related protein